MRSMHRDQTGLVGRFVVGWLLLVGLLGIGAVDGASIAFTTFRLSDIGRAAATEAESKYVATGDANSACGSAAHVVEVQDPAVTLVRCRIDQTGDVTITLRKRAATLVVGRVDALKKHGLVTRTETRS